MHYYYDRHERHELGDMKDWRISIEVIGPHSLIP